ISDYRQTLCSYRKLFGEAPPADVWPEVDERFGAGLRARRVKLQEYWLIPKPVSRRTMLALLPVTRSGAIIGLIAAALSLVVAGCAGDASAPGLLTGPEFMQLQFGIWLVSVLIAWVLKNRRPAVPDVELPELHPYEVAHLSGGPSLALDSALTSLIARGKLVCDHATSALRVTPEPLEPAHPLEQEVHACVAQTDGLQLAAIRRRAGALTLPLAKRLEALGLTGQSSRLPFWVAMTASVVGGLRILSRLGSDHPIGGLVLLSLLGVWLAWLMFARVSQRTPAGDAVLTQLRQDHQTVRELPSTLDSSATGPLTLSIALFGLGVLANTPLSDWSALVTTTAGASEGDGGGGDDGGDGGGGCGGGCGGCGGCGGGE
ncbi:MAG TPA: TIGR04222 domain-containing membrane protein, partial [Polyangiaceae bacterium]|nr:TIGR04222 domain-containing membrane protein [Polyangiaceae bacterium]